MTHTHDYQPSPSTFGQARVACSICGFSITRDLAERSGLLAAPRVNVSVWVSADSRSPVWSHDFTGRTAQQDADAKAAQLRAQVTRQGSTHLVTVSPVVVQGAAKL